jgi:hypothetical protein
MRRSLFFDLGSNIAPISPKIMEADIVKCDGLYYDMKYTVQPDFYSLYRPPNEIPP